MELDLETLLRLHGGDTAGSSDDDDETVTHPHIRTVDEILNDSESSSSSSLDPLLPDALGAIESATLQPDVKPVEEPPASHETLEETSSNFPWRRTAGSFPAISSLGLRSYLPTGSPSRSAHPVFAGVLANPKPGAALAAAAAASRSVLTPYAAAIKSRRAGAETREKLADEHREEAAPEHWESASSEALESSDRSEVENHAVDSILADSQCPQLSETVEEQKSSIVEGGNASPSVADLELTEEQLDDQEQPLEEQLDVQLYAGQGISMEADGFFGKDYAEESQVALVEEPNPRIDDFEDAHSVEGPSSKVEEIRSESEIFTPAVDASSGQLDDTERAERQLDKKLLVSMKPLVRAEEMEKWHASSGLHLAEGAAAQPMRLEGIRRGPPAIGYLQIDIDNAITKAVSSQAFKRDHGSPQALAVHVNFIAIGMSKGIILVVPSKYSPHSSDNMDTKMLTLGFHGEKSQTSVASMCFNQQGDFLLAGYGDGHVAFWDTQKAIAAKVIFGEHTAPVVHTMFLGQDSQITRQFKAVTGDSKGIVLLHTISVSILLSRFSMKTQCLLDGQKTGTLLSACPVLFDDAIGNGLHAQGNSMVPASGLTSMVGGVVGGVVGGEAGRKLFNEGASLAEEGVVVFATHQNALVVRLSSTVEKLEKYKTFDKPDGVKEGSLPYTAWKCTNGSSLDRYDKASWLAIAWDRRVQVAKLVKSEMTDYKAWNLDSSAIGVAWLDDQMLVILTLRGQLCLFAKDGTELHRTSFVVDGMGMDDIITYQTYFTNNFGNPEKAYNNSIAVRGASIYILGPMHLIVSRLLPWKERIQALQKAGDWMGALDMSMRLYDGFAHGVIDLPRTPDAIREAIMPYIVELILSYVDEVFSYISVAFSSQNGKFGQVDAKQFTSKSVNTEIEEQYARVGGVAVEFCVHIKRTDILFDAIFSKFVDVQHGGTFLEILEPYILKDMLGCLPPEIMHALVEHYHAKGWLQRVEQCVLHMDISSLDFNQVVKLCREHGLYGALIYLFNRGLDDYKAPLDEFLVVLQNDRAVDATSVGYRMLIYLKYCFLGLAFPPGHGTIPASRTQSVTEELLNFLLEESKSSDSHVSRTVRSTCWSCPNMCYLLWFDTEATLQVLRFAFMVEPLKSSTSLANHNIEREGISSDGLHDHNNVAQSLLTTLVSVLNLESDRIRSFMMEHDNSVWPSDSDLGELFQFVVLLVTCCQANISARVLNHVFEYLTKQCDHPGFEAVASKKEKQVVALLKAVPETYWNSSYMLQICTNAQFHQACGFIHQIGGQYVAALYSFMKDFNEPVHSFAFINKVLSMSNDKEVPPFRSVVISLIHELVKLNRECTYFLVIDHFNIESQEILLTLHSQPRSLFLFLKTVVEVHLSGALNFPVLDTNAGHNLYRRFNTPNELEAYVEKLSSFPKLLQRNTIDLTDEIAELYLELLCQFERHSVLKFLETFENYRLEYCLRLCQKYEVIDAAAFLLERVGDVGSALVLVMTGLEEKFNFLVTAVGKLFSETKIDKSTYKDMLNDISRMNEVTAVHDILHASMGLCQRNTRRLDLRESESLWFRLLDSFSEPLKRIYKGKEGFDGWNSERKLSSESHWKELPFYGSSYAQGFKLTRILQRVLAQFVGEIIEEMAKFIPLPAVMSKLLYENGGQEFGDFKLTILGILGSYGYETRILDTAKSLIEDDTFYTMSLLKKGATHAYAPHDFSCCLCGCSLMEGRTQSSTSPGVRVFSCGHATHLQCESGETEASSLGSSAGCPVCLPKKNLHAVPMDDGLVAANALRSPETQATSSFWHTHEPDKTVDKSYAFRNMSRFEILGSLQKPNKSLHINTAPQLRLSPPAIYHEKVLKRVVPQAAAAGDTSNGPPRTARKNKRWQAKDPRSKVPLPPPKPSITFGAQKK